MKWIVLWVYLIRATYAVEQYNGNNSPEEQMRAQNAANCKVAVSTGWQPNDCIKFCAPQIQAADGSMNSQTCVATNAPMQTDSAGNQFFIGKCSCDNKFVNELATTVLEALPKIAEISKMVFFEAITAVLTAPLSAIPGVGEALDAVIDSATVAAVVGAKVCAQGFKGAEQVSQFKTWLGTAVPATQSIPSDVQGLFNRLISVPDKNLPSGYSVPKVAPPEPKPPVPEPPVPNPPAPKPEPEAPKPKPKTKNPQRTTDSSKTSAEPTKESHAPTASDCAVNKRAGKPGNNRCGNKPHGKPAGGKTSNDKGTPNTNKPGKNKPDTDKENPKASKAGTDKPDDGKPNQKQTDKNNPKHQTSEPHITKKKDVTVTVESKSHIKTVTRQCDGKKFPQACLHYRSVIREYKDRTEYAYTCSDDHQEVRKVASETVATDRWSLDRVKEPGQHHASWTKIVSLNQESVAWNYFEKESKCDRDEWPPAYFWSPEKQKSPGSHGQMVRYIPRRENRGVAAAWRKFCRKGDGGKGNADSNRELAKTKRVFKRGGKDEPNTTSLWIAFTRAVFEFEFINMPKYQDDGLKENPCWPSMIAPDDPGFALLTDDRWYNKHPDAKKTAGIYAKPPEQAVLVAAEKRAMAAGKKLPTPAAPPRRRRVELIHDGIIIDEGNSTRRLTREEVKDDFEVLHCSDANCSRERRAIGDSPDLIVIPGLEVTQPAQVAAVASAVPTYSNALLTTFQTRTQARKTALPDMPVETGL